MSARPLSPLLRLAIIGAAVATFASLGHAETSSWTSRVEGPKDDTAQRRGVKPKALPAARPQVKDIPLEAEEPRAKPPGAARVAIGPPLPFRIQAPAGEPSAATAYMMLDQGLYVAALRVALAAVDKREREAYTLIGRIYEEGLGVSQNQPVAAQWYRQGAELGDPNAQFALGLMYAEGRGIGKDLNRAGNAFEAAAQQGHEVAQYNLALLHVHGEGRPENLTQAAFWLEKAARSGHLPAQYDLATLYLTGEGVRGDLATAAQWMRRAAEGGHVSAQLEYARLLAKGDGVAKDGKKAFAFIKAAAEQGNAVAQNRLARFYFHGVEVERDAKEGAKWHLLARARGVSDARLDLLLAQLSTGDRDAATAAAASWQARETLQ
jgi:hypothetical protein